MSELWNDAPPEEELYAEPTPEEPVEEAQDQPEERARDPLTGRFVAKEDTPEEPVEEQPSEEATPSYAGRFSSPEELEKGYQHVEQWASRVQTRNSELEQQLQQMQQRLAEVEQRQSEPAPVRIDWDELVEERPWEAAMVARQHNDVYHLQKAIEAWEELTPGAPQLWVQQVQAQAELNDKIARMEAQLAPAAQRFEQVEVTQSVAAALTEIQQRHPDFEQLYDDIGREVALIVQGGRPDLQRVFETGTHQQKVEILDHLVNAARGRRAGNIGELAAHAGRIHAQETEAAKAAATAVSARTNVPVANSPDEALGAAWGDLNRRFDDGWLTQE